MYIIFKSIHSLIADVALLSLIITIIYSLVAIAKNKEFANWGRKLSLVTLISCHVQLLAGISIYILSPLGLSNLSSSTMKIPAARLYALEHPVVMILALTLITIGYSKSKGERLDKEKFKTIAIYYTIGFILILTRLPWATWFA